MAIVAAVSDVHSPLYLKQFLSSLGLRFNQAGVLFLAGDMVWKGRVSALKPVLNGVRKVFKGKIIAIFGNEEHDELKDRFLEGYPEVLWLDDSETTLEFRGKTIRVVGTKGTLNQPTSWQDRNIPNIREIYSARVQRIREMLQRKASNSINLLLTHYSPTSLTIEGEDKRAYPVLMDERMEAVIGETKPDLVIHGHSHNSGVLSARIDATRIYNVAFPARKGITMIDI